VAVESTGAARSAQGGYESEACFEKAVQGAASIVRHLAETGFDADLWAGGTSTIRVADYAASMEALAQAMPMPQLDLRAAASRLANVGRGGALVLVSGMPDHVLLEVQRLFGREFATTVVMTATENVEQRGGIPTYRGDHRAGGASRILGPGVGESDGQVMGNRLGKLIGVAAIALALARLDRLLEPSIESPPWQVVLIGAAVLGGLLTWAISAARLGGGPGCPSPAPRSSCCWPASWPPAS
jgi:hypothetical protein